MTFPFVPYPQRCRPLTGKANITRATSVILQMPVRDERLVRAAGQLFDDVAVSTGSYALFSANSFAPAYTAGRAQGYLLRVQGGQVQLAAQDACGVFYALQTLRQWLNAPRQDAFEVTDWPELTLRSDYLDMRGLYPVFENLLVHIAEMAQYKLNTLVIEYEDKLPRENTEFCAENALTPQQHATLMATARENFIDVIPLQQSFGHLEYALKLPQYRALRETPDTPGEMCPLRPGAFALASQLIEETARLHPDSRFVHLGCDEVWSLGTSPECAASGKSRGQISVEFINRLAEYTISLDKTPIVWHDMLAPCGTETDVLERLHKQVVIAIWLYSSDTVNNVGVQLIERLDALGIAWLPCCSVRAYDEKPSQNYPCTEQRLRNIDAWFDLLCQTRATGMINTNWYGSFALGSPYGLFETSRYTAFYAAERCWNMHRFPQDYLERFLAAYHGLYHAPMCGGAERRYDYYALAGALAPQMARHADTARLIGTMRQLESAFEVSGLAFRGELFSGSAVELDCLRERYHKGTAKLDAAERDLREILPRFLTPDMAKLYFASRTYHNNLLRRELARMLNEPSAEPATY